PYPAARSTPPERGVYGVVSPQPFDAIVTEPVVDVVGVVIEGTLLRRAKVAILQVDGNAVRAVHGQDLSCRRRDGTQPSLGIPDHLSDATVVRIDGTRRKYTRPMGAAETRRVQVCVALQHGRAGSR